MGIKRNTFWSVFSNGIAFALMLISQVIIARNLGAGVLGQYYLMVTLNSMVTSLLNFGVGLSNMTFAAKKEYPVSELNAGSLFYAFVFGAFGLLLLGLAGIFGVNVFGELKGSCLLIPFMMLPLTIYILYWNSLMVGLEKILLQSKATIVLSFLWCGMNIFSVYSGFGLKGLMYSWVLYAGVSFLLMLVIAWRQDKSPYRLNRHLLRSSLAFGFKGNIGEIATQVWRRFNIFLLNYFHGVGVVGMYSVASELNEKVLLATGPVRNAVAYRISSAQLEASASLTAKVSRNVFFGLAIITVLLMGLAGFIIPLLYGSSFTPAVNPLRLLLLGTLTVGIAPIISIYFIGQMKRPGLLSALAVFNAVISILAGLAFIPSLGIYGVALGYSISCIIGTVTLVYFFKKFSGSTVKEIFVIEKDDLREYKKLITGK